MAAAALFFAMTLGQFVPAIAATAGCTCSRARSARSRRSRAGRSPRRRSPPASRAQARRRRGAGAAAARRADAHRLAAVRRAAGGRLCRGARRRCCSMRCCSPPRACSISTGEASERATAGRWPRYRAGCSRCSPSASRRRSPGRHARRRRRAPRPTCRRAPRRAGAAPRELRRSRGARAAGDALPAVLRLRRCNPRPIRSSTTGAWWTGCAAILELDPRSQYPLFAAARVYAETAGRGAPAASRSSSCYAEFLRDPNRRWPWLAHAALLAKHRLKDLPLARRYAAALAAPDHRARRAAVGEADGDLHPRGHERARGGEAS